MIEKFLDRPGDINVMADAYQRVGTDVERAQTVWSYTVDDPAEAELTITVGQESTRIQFNLFQLAPDVLAAENAYQVASPGGRTIKFSLLEASAAVSEPTQQQVQVEVTGADAAGNDLTSQLFVPLETLASFYDACAGLSQ